MHQKQNAGTVKGYSRTHQLRIEDVEKELGGFRMYGEN
jgi:hypothetical protein